MYPAGFVLGAKGSLQGVVLVPQGIVLSEVGRNVGTKSTWSRRRSSHVNLAPGAQVEVSGRRRAEQQLRQPCRDCAEYRASASSFAAL